MKWVENIKTVYKLGILVIIAFFSLGSIGFTGYYDLKIANDNLHTMYEDRLIPVKIAYDTRSDIRAMNGFLLESMLTADRAKNQTLLDSIQEKGQDIEDKLSQLEDLSPDPQSQELFLKIKASHQQYDHTKNQIAAFAKANLNDKAYNLYETSGAHLSDQFVEDMRALGEYYASLSHQADLDYEASFKHTLWFMGAIVAAALFLLAGSGYIIASSLTKPLGTMVEVCNDFAAGDFRDKQRQSGAGRTDEIGLLYQALAAMQNNLRPLIKGISTSAEQVAASSQELTASSEQSAQAAGQVASSISQIALGAEQQLSAANETASIVGQMSLNMQEIAAKANQVSFQSSHANDQANQGITTVEKAVAQMTQIEGTVNSSADVVAKLGRRSQEIGEIVNTISGIAAQTNLLALNAAIEAARAGEQGRGFAVVADEVRKLAEQSQEAARQIALLISEIQTDTEQAVAAMNHGTREVKAGTEAVDAAGQSFREIAHLVTQVSDQLQEIAAGLQTMDSGGRQIFSSVQSIDQISSTTAAETQTVSAATEEQLASMEEISSSSQSLSVLAQNLQNEIARFKY